MEQKETIREWYRLYADEIYNYLIYYLNDKHHVEDILQEVFIRALKHVDRYKGTSHPKTWLISIARNLAMDEARKRKRQTQLFRRSQKEKHGISIEEVLIKDEKVSELYERINRLPEKYREIVIMRGILEWSPKEVAEITGYKEADINVKFHRAKSKLKDDYLKGGLANESF